jgi:hypothetical protein
MSKRWLLIVAAAVLLIVGGVAGWGVTRAADDPYRAETERLRGTVTWANQETQLIVFTPDGWQPNPSEEEYHVRVLADHWEDASGNYPLGYPSCLSPADASPISHRVELDILHREIGDRRAEHIAVHVECLD